MSNPQAYQVAIAVVNSIPAFSTSLPATMLECFFFGLYTTVVFAGYRALKPALPRTRAGVVALVAYGAMCSGATTHLALRLRWLARDVAQTRELRRIAGICMGALSVDASSATCFDVGNDYDMVAAAMARAGHGWILDMFLVINIVLGAGLLLWREYERAQTHRRAIGWVSLVAFLALIPMCIIGAYVDDALEDEFGTAALFIAWGITVWLALLGTIDLWRRRGDGAARSCGLPRVVALLLDSGIGYMLFWTVIMVWCAIFWDGTGDDTSAGRGFMSAIRALKAGALVDIVAMYPTLLLVLGALPARAPRASFAGALAAPVRCSLDSDTTARALEVPSVEIPKAAFAGEAYGLDGKAAGMV